MTDFCDCANCPHHCNEEDSADKDSDQKDTDQKMQKLRSDIEELGFKLEDTEDGLRVSR